jgi:hypothetical protein
MTRRVTVEVFDPASTRDVDAQTEPQSIISWDTGRIENGSSSSSVIVACIGYCENMFTDPLPSNEKKYI